MWIENYKNYLFTYIYSNTSFGIEICGAITKKNMKRIKSIRKRPIQNILVLRGEI